MASLIGFHGPHCRCGKSNHTYIIYICTDKEKHRNDSQVDLMSLKQVANGFSISHLYRMANGSCYIFQLADSFIGCNESIYLHFWMEIVSRTVDAVSFCY